MMIEYEGASAVYNNAAHSISVLIECIQHTARESRIQTIFAFNINDTIFWHNWWKNNNQALLLFIDEQFSDWI